MYTSDCSGIKQYKIIATFQLLICSIQQFSGPKDVENKNSIW